MEIWKKCIRFVICFIVMSVAPMLYVNAESAADMKQKAPIEVTNFKINKQSFKAGNKVKYSFTIKNIGIEDYLLSYGDDFDEIDLVSNYGEPIYYSGSDMVHVFWKSTRKQYVVQSFVWKKSDKKKGQLNISGKIPVQKGMKTGKWRMAAIYFEYEGQEFVVKDKREKVSADSVVPMLDFSNVDFRVSKTGKVDNKAPNMDLQSFKLSKTRVGKNQKSIFSLKVKDSCKIEEVVCIWDIYDKTNKSSVGDYYGIYRMKYNKKTKRYQCSVGLDVSCEGKAQLVGVEVRDIYGNEKDYYAYSYDVSTGEYTKKVSKYYNAYKNMKVQAK